MDSLVLAGAFDWYEGIKREDYFEKNSRDETFTEQLLRYGANFQNAASDQQNSLFGDIMEEMNTQGRPEVKPAVPWVDAVRLEKERELVGMYLSAHPLDRYYMELNYGMRSVKDFIEATPEEGKEIDVYKRQELADIRIHCLHVEAGGRFPSDVLHRGRQLGFATLEAGRHQGAQLLLGHAVALRQAHGQVELLGVERFDFNGEFFVAAFGCGAAETGHGQNHDGSD